MHSSTPDASIFDAEELKRLTSLKDVLPQGPVAANPSEVPKRVTECEYLALAPARRNIRRYYSKSGECGHPTRATTFAASRRNAAR